MSDTDSEDEPTVLVVEDEEALVEIYVQWLDEKYDTRSATSGEEALERLDRSVSVVLLDRLMPGMSGDEVLGHVRERSDARTAMVTAVEPDFDILRMGFDDYLTKPVRREELLETVDRLVARSSYAEMERELFSLIEKRAALHEAKPESELEDSEEFTRLEDRIESLRDALERTLPKIGDGEFIAMVRDLEEELEEGPER
jgi:DNA-binding response OmpR family regulator